jgi:GAF domain-containing protein
VTVERSGHFTRQAREAFWAPDQAEYAHGVAGRTWATQRVLPIINLPDPSDETHIADYARQSFVPLAWVRKTNERARSYFGIPIEVRGRPWGVVVLDSRDPCPPGVVETLDGDIQVAKHIAYAYSTAARALGKILEPH